MIYLLGYPRHLSYDFDWIQALMDHYGDTRLVHLGKAQDTDLSDAQLVVLMHSATAQGVRIPAWVFHVKHRCPWLMLSGNDYKHFNEKRKAASDLQIDVVATLAPDTPYRPGNGIGKVAHVPHALNPKAFHSDNPHEERPFRVGYRGIRDPDDLGDDMRNRTVERFMSVAENDVRWGVFDHPRHYVQWLGLCKSTPATEAGMLGMKAVSSRHFDSIGSGTALIMPKGDYSGCLNEEHYIRLDDNLANVGECMERVDDKAEWEAVTGRALAHVLEHHTYANRMQQLDELLWH